MVATVVAEETVIVDTDDAITVDIGEAVADAGVTVPLVKSVILVVAGDDDVELAVVAVVEG